MKKTLLNYYALNIKHILEMLLSLNILKIENWWDLIFDYLGVYHAGSGVIRLKNGVKFKINYGTTDKWSIHEIVIRDDYKLNKFIKQCRVIFDLGANIGVFSIYAASLKTQGLKIFSFEPDPKNFRRFLENIKLNGMTNQIIPSQIACSEKKSVKNLYLTGDHRAYSLLKKNNKYIKVKTDTLDNLFKKNDIDTLDLMKLDIEGGEYSIFYSSPTQVLRKIKNIAMEYHNLNKKEHNGANLQKLLKSVGFIVERNESIQHIVGSIYATQRS